MSAITDRLYLGSYEQARSFQWLKSKGVTHILNCSREIPAVYPDSFVYLNLNLDDVPEQDITDALVCSHMFIKWSLNKKDTVVFVHCMMGISRSSTMVIHYLMKSGMFTNYEDAYRYVRGKRDIIHPNSGFVRQLKSRYPSPGSIDVPFTTA